MVKKQVHRTLCHNCIQLIAATFRLDVCGLDALAYLSWVCQFRKQIRGSDVLTVNTSFVQTDMGQGAADVFGLK